MFNLKENFAHFYCALSTQSDVSHTLRESGGVEREMDLFEDILGISTKDFEQVNTYPSDYTDGKISNYQFLFLKYILTDFLCKLKLKNNLKGRQSQNDNQATDFRSPRPFEQSIGSSFPSHSSTSVPAGKIKNHH